MTNWTEKFDKEFKFTGLDNNPLEGLALEQDLKTFIRREIIEQLIEDAAKIAPNYTAADGNYGGEGFKQQLIAKWLNKNK